jgi:hypothetical protein
MKAPINRIFVTVEKMYQDEIKLTTLTLYKDTTFEPEWNVTTFGTVHSLPNRVETKFADDDFQVNVKVGDKLYFNYQILLDKANCVEEQGVEYWGIEYYNAIATVRDGEIIPVGSHILIEAVDEEITHSFLHIPEMARRKETNRGKVYKSNLREIPAGSIVEYDPIGKFENTIEGKKFFCMFNSNIYYIHKNN